MSAMKKYFEYIDNKLKEEVSYPGHLKIHSADLCHVNHLFDRLNEITQKQNNREKLLSPLSRRAINYSLGEAVDLFNLLKRKLAQVKLLQCYCTDIPELHYISVKQCSNLIQLRLDMVPPSTLYGLFELKNQLQSIEFTNSGITSLASIFIPSIHHNPLVHKFSPMILSDRPMIAPPPPPTPPLNEGGENGDAIDAGLTAAAAAALLEDLNSDEYQMRLLVQLHQWTKLISLKLSNCGISKLDASFHFLPYLASLDLSRNQFSHVIHLQDCYRLKFLNLSHNRIKVLSNFHRVLGNIKVLDLSYNQIESLDGLERLFSLQQLNLSHNNLRDFNEICYLIKLPCLESIELTHNPLSVKPYYRLYVFRQFLHDSVNGNGGVLDMNRPVPKLDGEDMTEDEKRVFRGIMFRSLENDRRQITRQVFDDGEDGEGGGMGSPHPAGPLYNSCDSPITVTTSSIPKERFKSLASSSFAVSNRHSFGGGGGNFKSRASMMSTISADEYIALTGYDEYYRDRCNPRQLNGWKAKRRQITSQQNERSQQQFLLSLDAKDAAVLSEYDCSSKTSIAEEFDIKIRGKGKEMKVEMVDDGGEEGMEVFPSVEQIKEILSNQRHHKKIKLQALLYEVQREKSRQQAMLQANEEATQAMIATAASEMYPGGGGGSRGGSYPSSPERYPVMESCSPDESMMSIDIGSPLVHRNAITSFDINESIRSLPSSPNPAHRVSLPTPQKTPQPLVTNISPNKSSIRAPPAFPTEDTLRVAMQGGEDHGEGEGRRHALEEDLDVLHMMTPITPRNINFQSMTTFAGNKDHAGLLVRENLELYFREQIFAGNKPTGYQPYIRYPATPSTAAPAASTAENEDNIRFVQSLQAIPTASDSNNYIRQERFLGLFVEKVVPLGTTNIYDNGLLHDPRYDVSGSDDVKTKSKLLQSIQQQAKVTNQQINVLAKGDTTAAGAVTAAMAGIVEESLVIIAVTSLNVYLLQHNGELLDRTFGEAPIPVLMAYHPIADLMSCNIFFGFQRCMLSFANKPSEVVMKAMAGEGTVPSTGEDISLTSYVVITREKSHTYPIITKIPQLANSAREVIYNDLKIKRNYSMSIVTSHNKSLQPANPNSAPTVTAATGASGGRREVIPGSKEWFETLYEGHVKILNKDNELLNRIVEITRVLNSDPDIVYYQMLYQTWRKFPGIYLPRTVIITPTYLFLCHEELKSPHVNLSVVDYCHIRDISKLQLDESSNYYTIVLKSSTLMAATRKWRLKGDNKQIVTRLHEECKRICHEHGNTTV